MSTDTGRVWQVNKNLEKDVGLANRDPHAALEAALLGVGPQYARKFCRQSTKDVHGWLKKE